jgi:putative nucleotidyltransferase with HDIG domain
MTHVPLVARIGDDLDALGDLPALSPVVAQLNATLGREDVGVNDVEAIIRRDPVIAARVVSAANAAAYATRTPATSIRSALMKLGLVRVRRLTMLVGLYNAMPVTQPLQQAFWRHSLAVAQAADVIGRRVDVPVLADVVFLAGLLHDLGLLVLTSHYAEDLALVRAAASRYETLHEAERDLMGIDHPEIGARLAESWAFPDAIVSAIRFHHRPSLGPAEARPTAAVICLAEGVCAGDPTIDLEEGAGLDAEEMLAALGVMPQAQAALVADARAEAVRAAGTLDSLR